MTTSVRKCGTSLSSHEKGRCGALQDVIYSEGVYIQRQLGILDKIQYMSKNVVEKIWYSFIKHLISYISVQDKSPGNLEMILTNSDILP